MEEDKLVTLGLALGDILNYKQTFCQMKERKLYMDRADELRRKIRLVHSGKSNTVNKPIYVRKVYTVNVGIKCMETIHRTGMKKYTLKKMQFFQLIYQKKQSMMNSTILLDPIIKSSENLKLILVHIVGIVSNNT